MIQSQYDLWSLTSIFKQDLKKEKEKCHSFTNIHLSFVQHFTISASEGRNGKTLMKTWLGIVEKNPAYGKHRLSRRVRKIAQILWNPSFLTLFCTFWHFLALYSHLLALFGTFCEFSGNFCGKKDHVSHVTSHMSHVTCDLPPVTNANSHRPPPADTPFIHSRLVPDKKKTLISHGQKTMLKLS